MKNPAIALLGMVAALYCSHPAGATEPLRIERMDDEQVVLLRDKSVPAMFWFSDDTVLDDRDTLIARDSKSVRLITKMPAAKRAYIIMQEAGGDTIVAGERLLPLEKSSNFRDLGGYATRDGKLVRWGRVYRSGAMPILAEADYKYLEHLGIDTVVDLRTLEERELAPDLIDDRLGVLFVANDYSIVPLLAKMSSGNGENMYRGIEETLVPQLRSMFRRVLAGDGAVVYHCSAGQDRTGVATALIYDVLGVDRDTIIQDYHLSTGYRRVQFEMPLLNSKDFPNNIMAKFYLDHDGKGPAKAEPLYTPSGQSHLAQFFTHLDARYGGTTGYLKQKLGFSEEDLERFRNMMLQ